LNSVKSRLDTIVPKDAGKASRLRQVRLPVTLRYAMLLAALLGLWQIYVTFVGQISLPGPLEVAGALSEGWSSGRLAAATGMTLGTLWGCSSGR
jgi:ABC-type nitrate/sulfonate/bicarbonate transport system permease component